MESIRFSVVEKAWFNSLLMERKFQFTMHRKLVQLAGKSTWCVLSFFLFCPLGKDLLDIQQLHFTGYRYRNANDGDEKDVRLRDGNALCIVKTLELVRRSCQKLEI